MKTIKHTFGIFALMISLSLFATTATASAKNPQSTVIAQIGDIDPPAPRPLPIAENGDIDPPAPRPLPFTQTGEIDPPAPRPLPFT